MNFNPKGFEPVRVPEPPKHPNLTAPPSPMLGLTKKAIEATEEVQSAIEVLTSSSKQLETLTATLIGETSKVYGEVTLLKDSSLRLEELTRTLKRLTWALIFLTVATIIIAIGIEVWKAYHVEVPEIKVVLPHPPPAPQTPTLPPG